MDINIKNKIYKLHQKYVQGVDKDKWLDLTWTHSLIVLEISNRISRYVKLNHKIEVDLDLVEKGSLVHDIGVYNCFDEDFNPDKKLPQYISHGTIGYEILKTEEFDERVARFPMVHIGTGITSEDIKRESFPLEEADYIPITLEEEIVCYADKFHTKYPKFCSYDKEKLKLQKFDLSKGIIMDRFKKKFGVPDLSDLELKYAKWHKEFDEYFNSLQHKTA